MRSGTMQTNAALWFLPECCGICNFPGKFRKFAPNVALIALLLCEGDPCNCCRRWLHALHHRCERSTQANSQNSEEKLQNLTHYLPD